MANYYTISAERESIPQDELYKLHPELYSFDFVPPSRYDFEDWYQHNFFPDEDSYVYPDIPVPEKLNLYTIVNPSEYDPDAPGSGITIKSPDPFMQSFDYFAINRTRFGYVDERFQGGDYDEPWEDGTEDPAGYGDVQILNDDLKVGWGNVPFAFKKVLTGQDDFGEGVETGVTSFIKNIALEVGQMGVIAQGLLSEFETDDPRHGSWLPDEAYFGVHIQGLSPSRSLYVILAHTDIYLSSFDENGAKEIVGPDTETMLILTTEATELVELKQYNNYLGGGAGEISLVGPSGVDEDGNFDPTLFGKLPLPVAPWDYTTIDPTTETFDVGYQADVQAIGPGGSTMYIWDKENDLLKQYELSTPGNVTTAVLTGSISISNDEAVSFSGNGEHFYYITGNGYDYFCHIYTMSTPWDINTASSAGSVRISPSGVYYGDMLFRSSVRFNGDGTMAYILNSDYSEDGMFVGPLSTPWDMGTYDADSAVFYGYPINGYRQLFMGFDPTGENAYFFVLGAMMPASVKRNPVSTPWDLNTFSSDTAGLSFLDGSWGDLPNGETFWGLNMAIHPSGGFAYATDNNSSSIVRKYVLA